MNIFIVILISLFFIIVSIPPKLCVVLNTADYQCLKTIVNYYNIDTFSTDSTGTFNFCNVVPLIDCDNNGNLNGTVTLIASNTTQKDLDPSKFTCLSNFITLDLNGFNGSTGFFQTKLSCSSIIYRNVLFVDKLILLNSMPQYDSIEIISTSFINSTLKLSTLFGLKTFKLSQSTIIMENNLGSNLNSLTVLELEICNFVDFSYLPSLQKLNLTISPCFQDRFDLIYTISSEQVYISSQQGAVIPLAVVSAITPNYTYITVKGDIERPTSIIDLTSITKQYTMTIIGAPSLNINGKYPFINKANVEIRLYNCSIQSVQPFNQFGDQNIFIHYSIAQSPLGIFDGSIRYIDFSNNSITSTIDSSWCNTQISLSNNQMEGVIPSCFSCYFNAPISPINPTFPLMYDRFVGNNFKNLDRDLPCTTFAPRVNVFNDSRGVLIYGTDIGYEPSFWNIETKSGALTRVYGKEYLVLTSKFDYFINRDRIVVEFSQPIQQIITFPTRDNFSLPTISLALFSTTTTTTTLSIYGEFFSSYLGYSYQSIKVNGVPCEFNLTSFTNVNCSFSNSDDFAIDLNVLQITVGNLTREYIIKIEPGFYNNIQCPNNCTDSIGICNLSSGNCEVPHFLCLNNCTDPTQGICDGNTGLCSCKVGKWFGKDCSLPYHYISSTDSSIINGINEISLYGFFGSLHNNLSVKIGDQQCSPITLNTSSLIQCKTPNGNGIKNVELTQNNYTYVGINIFKYINTIIDCPNKCSNNGICNTTNGICKCNLGFTLYDCSAIINTNGVGIGNNNNNNNNNNNAGINTTIDRGSGSTNIIDNQTKFQIYFKSLKEIDFNNNIVKEYPLLKNWSFNNTETKESNIYEFKQLINGTSNDCIVKTIIEEIKDENGKQFTFANTNFIVDYGSIKFTISITNYTYQSTLNSLQLDLISAVDQINENKDCNTKNTEIDTTNINDQSTFSYIKISKNNKILAGRFINKVISDSRPTFFSTTSKSDSNSVIVTLNLPHCNECIVDPDFSILVDSEFKTKCNDNSNSRKWLLPVVIVVPVVFVSILIVVLITLYKKNTTIKVILHSYKLKKLSNN
ncbi:hypothetical protein ACTA71_010467 [Dictyostelium dimigraforme]